MQKKQFIAWFMRHHRFKHREVRSLLAYIQAHPHLLQHIHFTESIPPGTRTIVIASTQSDKQGFLYTDGRRRTEDVARAMDDLMNHPSTPFYMIVHFYGKELNHHYQQLIDRPIRQSFQHYKRFEAFEAETKDLLHHISKTNKVDRLKAAIDKALDDRDHERFAALSRELRSLQETEVL
ncbi:YpiB family protein [Shouchella shacheensis]|uniref:YpiB family protein n=1 Tax=Shouchella shacheensis TaxID=1649580 RepID=UPI001FDF816B|nr:YpiB family protein [Shouchella shacheensis]